MLIVGMRHTRKEVRNKKMIFKVCLIIANAICIAITDNKIIKILNVLAIALMSISFIGG